MGTRVAVDLFEVVRDALSIICEQPRDAIGADTALADIGADSLARVELADILEERLVLELPGLHIPDADLERFASVGDVADYLRSQR